MAFKLTLSGLLIYMVMAAYFSAFLLTVFRKEKAGRGLFLAGFLLALVAFGYRWQDVNHLPMQNLFEIFLTMGMIMYPLSMFCRWAFGSRGEAADALIGVILLFPAGLVFDANPQHLPPALRCWLFGPHVAVYLLSYVVMIKAAVQASCQLITRAGTDGIPSFDYEEVTYRLICLGFPLLTLGLILGSWWGKLAWGDYWAWDPKELWSLVSWLVYVEYLHFRSMFGKRLARMNSCIAILGAVAIIITLLWVNLSRLFPGLHSYAN
ncbi:MAG: hypothetical protein C0404_01425 [Verrucomicrobia bacterium]|nr:hypothetical protein [Verrucomicrobiota bacterium]